MTKCIASSLEAQDKALSALIKTLQDTVQRIEVLTGGEVDAVTDGRGSTLLLGNAHEQLRRHEATRQAAILNALPAHIALIDIQGCILSVNDAWRDFGDLNRFRGPKHGLGLNYLDICDNATGSCASEARSVAEGIRSVLERKAACFSIEYTCHSPSEQRWFLLTVTPLSEDRLSGAVIMHDNITARKEVEARLHHQAYYDVLTGLPNRRLFQESLKKALVPGSDSGLQVAVMFLDLDNFKNVNDTLGHAIGDELLVQFSTRLTQCVRVRDTVGRLGGDEFALILMMQDGAQGAVLVAKKIQEAMRSPFDLQGQRIVVNASIGITVYPDDATDPDTLLKFADTAMYKAKQAGRDTFRFFTPQMNIEALARLDLETALRIAIDKDEFVLHYQPKLHIESGRIIGLEALVRWERPGHGLVSPNEFIPVLEETGLIGRVGSWVIATACRQIGLWKRSLIGPVQISVNVSARQFVEGYLQGDIIRGLADNDISGDLLELEVTESLLMANTEFTNLALDNVKKLGVQISVDDFGIGYSSLAYLRRFPIDKLKIDIAFIRDVTTDPDAAAITLAIITMAHSLKLKVVAEGVETEAQLEYLRCHQCDQIQGYYFSRPLPPSEIEKMLIRERSAALN